jgi:kynureninase
MTWTPDFSASEEFSLALDRADPLRHFRGRFHLPEQRPGVPWVYLCGHSLGLQPRATPGAVQAQLDAWARLGVEGHFEGPLAWYTYEESLRQDGAELVGARPDEVVFMNGLTVNLHLMLASFYRPTPERFAILLDGPTFPSDRYAAESHVAQRGLDPRRAVQTIGPRQGERLLRAEDVEAHLAAHGHETAVVLLAGVNFLTGQVLDLALLTAAAQARGCLVGLDLAHAAGNVPLALHDWGVDFAVWCGYKYLNAGPGAGAGCFVHQRHGERPSPRLAGWWGNDPATRFAMHLEPEFVPRPGASGWQLSNPPVLALVPLAVSLGLFREAGPDALRRKSLLLTGYLLDLVGGLPPGRCEVVTPADPAARGAQVSLVLHGCGRGAAGKLRSAGVLCDYREPNVVRAAPTPLYNTFHEVWRFVQALEAVLT